MTAFLALSVSYVENVAIWAQHVFAQCLRLWFMRAWRLPRKRRCLTFCSRFRLRRIRDSDLPKVGRHLVPSQLVRCNRLRVLRGCLFDPRTSWYAFMGNKKENT